MLTYFCIICKKSMQACLQETRGMCRECEQKLFYEPARIWRKRQEEIKSARECDDIEF